MKKYMYIALASFVLALAGCGGPGTGTGAASAAKETADAAQAAGAVENGDAQEERNTPGEESGRKGETGMSDTNGSDQPAPAYRIALPAMEGYGRGEDPWEWAEKMYQESAFVKTEPYETEHVRKTAAMVYQVKSSEDTYVSSGDFADANFGDSDRLMTGPAGSETTDDRMAFLKFGLDELPGGETLCCSLCVFALDLEDSEGAMPEVCLTDNGWAADTLTWNNVPVIPADGMPCAAGGGKSTWYKFDVSDAVSEARANGQTAISFVLKDDGTRRVSFASSRYGYAAPYLEAVINDGTRGDATPAPGDDPGQYQSDGHYLDKKRRTVSVSVPSRVLEDLPGYVMTDAEPELGAYGGRLDMLEEATGWYYVKKIGGRWWIIDPEGHPMIHMGVATIKSTFGDTDRLKELMLNRFGSKENWAEETVRYLKHDLYFNGGGGWCDVDDLLKAGHSLEDPFAMTEIVYFLKEYMSSIGIGSGSGGDTKFVNGGLNVFDPDFETFCDEFAAGRVAPRAGEKYFAAWMADNELDADIALLNRFLTADCEDPRNAYSYAAAWTFLKHYTGKEDPSIQDVTDLAREDFLDMVWDRYHKVVSGAIRKYDPNHMYWGSRAKEVEQRAGFFSGAGRYCDAFAVNYYGAWTPDRSVMTKWNAWGYDRPFVVTEWYAMGEDAHPLLKNSSGAGFLVATQKDRGLFYQNYALKLMETKSCVGFHWFTYMDNDPGAISDSSNVDSNKGLMCTMTYEPYEDLVTEMAELNRQAYRLIDYFDQ